MPASRLELVYPELVRARRCLLVDIDIEADGCCEAEVATLLHQRARAADIFGARQQPTKQLSGHAVLRSSKGFANLLLELPLVGECCIGGTTPDSG